MKKIKSLAAISLLVVGCMVSYYAGYHNNDTENYEAACHMADLIRCYKDHLNDEESVIEDYGCFEELEGLFLYDRVEEPIDWDKYSCDKL